MQTYDHTVIWAFIGVIILTLFCLCCLTIYIVYSNNKHRKSLEELTTYQIHVAANIDRSIPEILNLIIQESFDDYKVKVLVPLDEGYINSSREDEIRKALVDITTSRISNAALDKLSLFYNINNIAGIIADKIYITVMQYVIDHNRMIEGPNT